MMVETCQLNKMSDDGRWCGKHPVKCVAWDCPYYQHKTERRKRNMAAKWEIMSDRWHELKTGVQGERFWFFHLKANNGKIVLQSETYKTRAAAMKGIRAIQKNVNAEIKDYTK